MARTFQDDMADDVTNAFMTEFASAIAHYPLGVVADADAIRGVYVPESSERIADDQGERIVRRARLKVAATVTVTASESHRRRDTFLIAGKLWAAERIGDSDAALQSVHIVREEPITTKRSRNL